MALTKETIYKEIFEKARDYLLSLDGIDEVILDAHLNEWQKRKPKSLEDVLCQMLISASSKRNMPKTIGKVENLGPYIEDFNPNKINKKFEGDWRKTFNTIEQEYKPPRPMSDKPKGYWPSFCKTVISGSHFLSQFSNVEKFNDFVSRFYLNEYTRLALPLLLAKEISGLGFALACDFVKESGYPEFAKPDVHINAIFYGIGISKTNKDYEIFKDVIIFSKEIDKKPYCVDRLFWLVGSGNFHLNEIRIKTNRDKFIEKIRQEYSGKL